MQVKYCFYPDKTMFLKFLGDSSCCEEELNRQLRMLFVSKIFTDISGFSWELHFTCNGTLPDKLLDQIADKLKKTFALREVLLVRDSVMPETLSATTVESAQVSITDCCGTEIPEEIPLPPEPLTMEIGNPDPTDSHLCESETDDPLYEEAYKSLYEHKKDKDLLWGKKISGKVRKLNTITEEENKVVVEGYFVRSLDKDGGLQTFVEHELRSGAIMLVFNLSDETGGIFVKVRFDNREGTEARRECNDFKNLFKPGMLLRLQGNVAADKYAHDEMTLTPTGIMKVEIVRRSDNAPVKRVELHCHTKMSKMDGLTPMDALVKQAISWGHTALAITDHGVVQAFPFCYDAAEGSNLKLIFGMEGYLISDRSFKNSLNLEQEPEDTQKTSSRVPKIPSHHIIILATNETGLRNLYKLVTISHLRYLNRRPLLPRQVIEEHREGLLLGSACEAGELYRAVRSGASDKQLEEIATFYDYLEIQPIGNNMFLVRENICTVEDLKEHNKKIYQLGKKLGKLTVATCDVHFLNPEDAQLRAILQAGQNYKDADNQPPLYLHTTEEMLEEFAYLGKEAAYEVVVINTNKIADLIKKMKPVPDRDQLYAPFIPGAEDAVKDLCYAKAHKIYGEKLPAIVENRLKLELDAIIGNGFAVLYFIAHKLVKNSIDRGYLVGSRGSVGSSLVATMLDITEVNPLKPHYYCQKCHHSEFFLANEVDSGFDLPEKLCPDCGSLMNRNGHDIPFAVFLGFHGDKVPDIDLNFAGGVDPDDPAGMSDQAVAHKYTEELFGRDNVCRAGTISTIANKTAIGYVRKYYESRGLVCHSAKLAALVEGFAGIKRTTGQHPGGIMVVPRNMDIHYITPMNRPADDRNEKTITTHYDYHSINDRLVKLDILGHDDPMVLKMLEKYLREGSEPDFDPKEIPMGDEPTMRIFRDTSSLGVTAEQIGSEVGTFGIPECGTSFVRQMIKDVQPKNFSEVVRVSGYSHGTDVWLNNAQDLIKEGRSVAETISTRDDIMTHLIAKGVEPSLAFKIMEYVRKGKAAKKGLEAKMLGAMQKAGIPDWYIKSCEKIQYLFPKAHAVAYVLMAYRIAYCKVHYPKEFYASYFTVRARDFDYSYIAKGLPYIKNFIKNVYTQGYKASAQDKSVATYLELANEMMERGLKFDKLDIYASDPVKFKITAIGLRPPLAALSGVGESAAKSIAEVRDVNNPFISQEDLRLRTGISKSVVERLAELGALGDLPETNQISLFG